MKKGKSMKTNTIQLEKQNTTNFFETISKKIPWEAYYIMWLIIAPAIYIALSLVTKVKTTEYLLIVGMTTYLFSDRFKYQGMVCDVWIIFNGLGAACLYAILGIAITCLQSILPASQVELIEQNIEIVYVCILGMFLNGFVIYILNHISLYVEEKVEKMNLTKYENKNYQMLYSSLIFCLVAGIIVLGAYIITNIVPDEITQFNGINTTINLMFVYMMFELRIMLKNK